MTDAERVAMIAYVCLPVEGDPPMCLPPVTIDRCTRALQRHMDGLGMLDDTRTGVRADVHTAFRAWLGLPPDTIEQPDEPTEPCP